MPAHHRVKRSTLPVGDLTLHTFKMCSPEFPTSDFVLFCYAHELLGIIKKSSDETECDILGILQESTL